MAFVLVTTHLPASHYVKQQHQRKSAFFPERDHKHQSQNQDLTVTEGTGEMHFHQALKILRLEMGNKIKVLMDAATTKQF